jgi:hypothetical protein
MRIDTTDFGEHGEDTRTETAALHPVADFIERVEKRRERWLMRLSETREAKFNQKLKSGQHQEDSKVLVELEKVREALQKYADMAQPVASISADPARAAITAEEDAILVDD